MQSTVFCHKNCSQGLGIWGCDSATEYLLGISKAPGLIPGTGIGVSRKPQQVNYELKQCKLPNTGSGFSKQTP